MAGTTRLELATSAVTGRRSNQLSYVPNSIKNLANWPSRAADSLSKMHAGLNSVSGFFGDRVDTKPAAANQDEVYQIAQDFGVWFPGTG
jgi:hypothetical protein